MSTSTIESHPRSTPYPLKQRRVSNGTVSETIDLSESRAYDCALQILGAYRLTGNFAVALQIVLDDLGVLDQVAFEMEPRSLLSDCRHVEFRASENIDNGRFDQIMSSIKNRIGFDPTPRLWARLFG